MKFIFINNWLTYGNYYLASSETASVTLKTLDIRMLSI